MVKKAKAAKKAAPKKKAAPPKRAAKKSKVVAFDGAKNRAKAAKAAKAPAAKKRARRPEQQELIPGVRYADLDRYCANIGHNRDEINQFKGEGQSLEAGALRAMRDHGVTSYKSAGVFLTIIPGDSKLLVKRDKTGAADGGQVDAVATAADEDEDGEGQDPENIGEALTEGDADLEDVASEG